MNPYYLGIDPGKTGGLCVLNHMGHVATWSRFDQDGFYDILELVIANYPLKAVALELVHAMPGQGVTSMFSFGKAYGSIMGFLRAHFLTPTLVSPQAWQKLLPGEGEAKERVRLYCQKTWGAQHTFIAKGCRVPHQGAMDAAVMADYIRRVDLSLIVPPKERKKVKRKQPIRLD